LRDQGDALIQDGIALGVAGARGLVERPHDQIDHRRPLRHDRPPGGAALMLDEQQLAGAAEEIARLQTPGAVQQQRPKRLQHRDLAGCRHGLCRGRQRHSGNIRS
jgi:hypothetical protein